MVSDERSAAVRLKELRLRAGLGLREIAGLIGRSPSSYADYERTYKKRYQPMELVEALVPHLVGRGNPPIARDEVMSLGVGDPAAPGMFAPGSDVQPIQIRQPMEANRLPLGGQVAVMGTVSCGEDGQFEVNLTDGPIDYVQLPQKLVGVPGIIALFVAGESMAGVWSPGDTVYVSKKKPVTPGAYAVVQVEVGPGDPPAAYLKEYVRADNGKVVLRQYNPYMLKEIDRSQVREMWRALHWREWAM
jgi:hypothetical protein